MNEQPKYPPAQNILSIKCIVMQNKCMCYTYKLSIFKGWGRGLGKVLYNFCGVENFI